VSLVCKELLPRIQEKNGWSLDQCHARNSRLEGQPTGAGGLELGATAVVLLHIMTTDGMKLQVPCYVQTHLEWRIEGLCNGLRNQCPGSPRLFALSPMMGQR